MEVRPGYKQTEVGVIPDDWAACALGRSCELITKGTTPTSIGRNFTDTGVTFLKAESLSEDGRTIPGKVAFIDVATHGILKRSQLREGDLLISIAGVLGRVGLVDEADLPANTNQALAIVRLGRNTQVTRGFLFFCLRSSNTSKQIRDISVQAAQANISLQNVRDVLIPVPSSKSEQEAIAEALSDADALIESLQQLLAKKRRTRQGALQELLSGKRRLPGFSGEWEVTRLGDIGSTFGGLTGKSKRDFGHGDARYITFMNIMSNVVIDCDIFEHVDIKPSESQNRVAKGDLFFNGSSETPEEVGMCAVLSQEVQDVFLNSFCFGFRAHDGAAADGLYLAYFFRSGQGRGLLKSL